MKLSINKIFILTFFLSSCANLLNIRKDINDEDMPYEPTVGGQWPEGGMMDQDGRTLAEANQSAYHDSESWLNANKQDLYRKGLAYSKNQNLDPKVKRIYGAGDGQRTTREDFIDKVQSDGSLWAPTGQTNFFFTENRIKNPGDIISIQIEEPMVKDIGAEMKRTLNDREIDGELALAQERIRAKTLGLPEPGSDKAAATQAAPRTPAAAAKKGEEKPKEIEIPEATYADIDVTKSMALKPGEAMMGEVVERYPNGNYKVRATKRVNYPTGPRLLTMYAVAKGPDVEKKETIPSGSLYEYRLQVNR